MKSLVSLLFIMACIPLVGQTDTRTGIYDCQHGQIHFYASTPVEDIEATSNSAICVINTNTKKLYAKVQMASFWFQKKKMQEDFNEDYIESAKYPFGILEASIVENINFKKDGIYNVTLKGTFEVHGIKKDTEIKGKLTIKNSQPLNCTSTFNVRVADHNIKIPTIVVVKIAEVVKVDVNFTFEKYAIN